MCFNPVTIFTHPNSPQYIKDYYGKEHNVPCGKCVECRTKMLNDWTFRLKKEAMEYNSIFLTLTYETKHLKFNIKDKCPTLYYEDVTLFWKRLRKKLKYKIKYFLVGEYGGKTKRPHYHAIVFGLQKNDKTLNLIKETWKMGTIHIGTVEEASIKYTLKYCLKSAFSSDEDISHTPIAKKLREFDRQPEKAKMSKGIGEKYLQQVKNYDYLIENAGNANIRIPRYYIKKIYNDEDKEKRFHAQIKKQKKDKRTDHEKYMLKLNINRSKLKYLKKETYNI